MTDEKLLIISSDGHAGAKMADYRPYLDPEYRADFDAFLVEWRERGARNFDRFALEKRLDAEFVDEWDEVMLSTGRVDGFSDVHRRLAELEKEGVAAEVIFPDFGVPFELYSPATAARIGYPALDENHRRAGARAYNRWLVDYISAKPERFAAMAAISWEYDVEEAVREIRWAKDAGLKGVVLPEFSLERPLYHPDFTPIWDELAATGMVVNTHIGSSSTRRLTHNLDGLHPAVAGRVAIPELQFYCHNVLSQVLWTGIMERYPSLRFVFTETGSSWLLPMIREMDHLYAGSFFRSDYKHIVKRPPSEYFARQVFIGSSTFSRAEVAHRHDIGLNKMMLGMDFPHHEGTLIHSTNEYLRATIGAVDVPLDEARLLLSDNALHVYEFDENKLRGLAQRIGPRAQDVLTSPDEDHYVRGDVHKPWPTP